MHKYSTLLVFIFSLLVIHNINFVIGNSSDSAIFNYLDIDNAVLQAENNQSLSHEELSELISNAGIPKLSTTAKNLGYIYYINYDPNDANSWQIIRYNLDESSSTIIYTGKNEIQSVTGSLDGNVIIFNLQRKTAGIENFEIYRLQINFKSVHKLTETTTDEVNVSSSADGKHIVWQQKDNSFDKIYGRIYLTDTANAVYQDFFLDHFKSQRDPSISSNGRYLSLIRSITNNNDWVYLYDFYTGNYQLITQSSNIKAHPSVSADGQKVAWLVVDGSNKIMELKNLKVNAITTMFPNSANINHPHITADGNWLGYSQKVNRLWQVHAKNIITEVEVEFASQVNSVNEPEIYWQKPSSTANYNYDYSTVDHVSSEDKDPCISNVFACSNSFTETKKYPSNLVTFDRFGSSVATNGNTIVVGVDHNIQKGSDAGSVYVLEKIDNNWVFVTTLTASDGTEGDRFGVSVAISGDIIVVGNPPDDTTTPNAGSAHIFKRNEGGANNWGETNKLTPSDGKLGDQFGISVSIFNDTIVVGANLSDINGSDSGQAYVFERNTGGANNWGETKKLWASDGEATDHFGKSVSVYNDLIVVGAPTANGNGIVDDGAAYIFERNAGGTDNWGKTKKLVANGDNDTGGLFGNSVAIFADAIVVGANGESNATTPNNHVGAAYIFERNAGGVDNWGNVKRLVINSAKDINDFGFAVDISDSTIVVGAYKDSDKDEFSGAAYIFERNGGGASNWGEVRKLFANDAAKNDLYGKSLAITTGIIVIGSPQDNDGSIIDTGSVYIYE